MTEADELKMEPALLALAADRMSAERSLLEGERIFLGEEGLLLPGFGDEEGVREREDEAC